MDVKVQKRCNHILNQLIAENIRSWQWGPVVGWVVGGSVCAET